MYETKRTYLDLFLDNNSTPKKRERYFETEQEEAIIRYNCLDIEQKEKNKLFKDTIGTCFKKTILGVLEMPKFRHLPKALNKDELIEQTYFRLVEKIYKFTPGKIGKNGQPVKAFSYFSTIAKNFILEQITKHNKVIKHKADVETSIDLAILSEDTLGKISKNDFQEILLDDYVTSFQASKKYIIDLVTEFIIEEESKEDKKDSDLIKLGYCLKYLLDKWDKIEFMKKNEFMRILTLYTSFNQQKVSFLFKKFKVFVLKRIKPNFLNKKRKKDIEEVIEINDELFTGEEFIIEEVEEAEVEDLDEDEIDKKLEEVLVEETEEERILKYDIYSMDEYEAREIKLENAKIKIKRKEWKTTKKLKAMNLS